jgi:hypothetical protein
MVRKGEVPTVGTQPGSLLLNMSTIDSQSLKPKRKVIVTTCLVVILIPVFLYALAGTVYY